MNGAFSHSNSLAPSVSDKLSSALTVFGFRLLRPLSSFFSLVSSARGLFSLSVPLSTSHPSQSVSSKFPRVDRSTQAATRQASRRAGERKERQQQKQASSAAERQQAGKGKQEDGRWMTGRGEIGD